MYVPLRDQLGSANTLAGFKTIAAAFKARLQVTLRARLHMLTDH